MGNLDLEVQSAFDAISLILVFVTVLFGLRYREIQRDIDKEIPSSEKTKGRERHRKELLQSLLINCAPLVLVNGAGTFLFLPLLFRIFTESQFALWAFDFSRTAYVFVALLVFALFLWSAYLGIRLIERINRSR